MQSDKVSCPSSSSKVFIFIFISWIIQICGPTCQDLYDCNRLYRWDNKFIFFYLPGWLSKVKILNKKSSTKLHILLEQSTETLKIKYLSLFEEAPDSRLINPT